MTFIAIIASLLLDRVVDANKSLRALDTLNGWLDRELDRVRDNGCLCTLVLLAAMLGPAVLAHWLAQLFDGVLFGLLALTWSIAVLWVCLGPLPLEAELDAYLQAAAEGDTEVCDDRAWRLSGVSEFADDSARHQAVIRAVFAHMNTHIVAVLFWFVAFGPFGAVLYRIALQLIDKPAAGSQVRKKSIERVAAFMGALTWLPARLTIMAYALAGKFGGTLTGFLGPVLTGEETSMFKDNNTSLSDAGVNALALHPDQPVAIEAVHEARRLSVRALVVCLVALAVATAVS